MGDNRSSMRSDASCSTRSSSASTAVEGGRDALALAERLRRLYGGAAGRRARLPIQPLRQPRRNPLLRDRHASQRRRSRRRRARARWRAGPRRGDARRLPWTCAAPGSRPARRRSHRGRLRPPRPHRARAGRRRDRSNVARRTLSGRRRPSRLRAGWQADRDDRGRLRRLARVVPRRAAGSRPRGRRGGMPARHLRARALGARWLAVVLRKRMARACRGRARACAAPCSPSCSPSSA